VERGRAIYDNLVKFVRFQLSTNIGAILTIVVARAAALPTPFSPVQILWVNLIMDGPPALALGVDPPEPDVMERRPRDPGEPILGTARLLRLLVIRGRPWRRAR
jgi:Ca2+-transporting ATPase